VQISQDHPELILEFISAQAVDIVIDLRNARLYPIFQQRKPS
jgi:hypothetical protein